MHKINKEILLTFYLKFTDVTDYTRASGAKYIQVLINRLNFTSTFNFRAPLTFEHQTFCYLFRRPLLMLGPKSG